MTRSSLLLVAIAGCGGAVRTAAPLGNAAATTEPRRVDCPTGTELEAVARKAWNAPSGTITPSCIALRAGEPLWLINGYVERDSDHGWSVDEHTTVMTPDATIRFEQSNLDTVKRTGQTYSAVDLDGDGRDELILETGFSRGGYDQAWIMAVGLTADGKLVTPGQPGLPLSADNTVADPDPAGVYSCDSTHQLIGRPGGGKLLEIVGQPQTGARRPQCPKVGRHIYSWNGNSLVVATP